MTDLMKLVKDLILEVEELSRGSNTTESLEKITTELIEHDAEYLQNPKLSELVYELDMNDIEGLKSQDYERIAAELRAVAQQI